MLKRTNRIRMLLCTSEDGSTLKLTTENRQLTTPMTLTQRWHDIRTGFERPFWVANISELFERLSYYAAFASLARYLHETLQFPVERASYAHRVLRRPRLVSRRLRRHARRPHGLPPRALGRVPHPELLVLPAGIAWALHGWRPSAMPCRWSRWQRSSSPCPRSASRWSSPASSEPLRARRRKTFAPSATRFTTRW